MDRLTAGEEVVRIILFTLVLFLLTLLAGLIFSFTPQDIFPFSKAIFSWLILAACAVALSFVLSLIKRGSVMDGYDFKDGALNVYRGKKTKSIPLSSIIEVTHVYGLDSLFGLDAVVVEGKGKSVTIRLRKKKATLFYTWLADALDSGSFKDDLLSIYEKNLGPNPKKPY